MPNLGIGIVREYERGVVFRFGKIRNVREPGMRFMIPLVDRMQKVTLRTVTMPIQSQQIITKDNVSIGVAAVAYFRRVDPVKSIVEIEDVESAIDQIAQTTVRNVVGRSPLDQVFSETETLNESIKKHPRCDDRALGCARPDRGAQGHRAARVDEAGDGSRGRSGTREARQDHRRRGRGAQRRQARRGGRRDHRHPIALQLRNLQVLAEIAIEKNSTIIFPAQFLDSVRAVSAFVSREAETDRHGRLR